MNTLENLVIEGTKNMPRINFETNGRLYISGIIIPDNAVPFFETLTHWTNELCNVDVVFDVEVEYMNTSATMQLFGLLRSMEENINIRSLTVNWHYEEDDEDHFDTGQFFEEKLDKAKFKYLLAAA